MRKINDGLTCHQRYRLHHPEKAKEYRKKHREHAREYYRKNKSSMLEHAKESRARAYKRLEEYFGTSCWSCGRENKGKRHFHLHEINGINHRNWYPEFYLKDKGRFILLCPQCHNTFHTLMDVGYSVEEILKILKWEYV